MAVSKAEQQVRNELMGQAGVATYKNNYLIEAGAGAGKTYTMTNRIITQLATKFPGGYIAPEKLVAITFTEKATQEMMGRIDTVLQEKLQAAIKAGNTVDADRLQYVLDNISKMHISTIHSFCQKLLNTMPYYSKLGPDFQVMDDDEASAYAGAFYNQLITQPAEAKKLQEVVDFTGLSYSDIKKAFLLYCNDLAELANPDPEVDTRVNKLLLHCISILAALCTSIPLWKLKYLLFTNNRKEFEDRFRDAVALKTKKGAASAFPDPIEIKWFSKIYTNNVGTKYINQVLALDDTKIFDACYSKLTSKADIIVKQLLSNDKLAFLEIFKKDPSDFIAPFSKDYESVGGDPVAVNLELTEKWYALVFRKEMELLKEFIELYRKAKERDKKITQGDLLRYTRDMLKESPEARRYFHQCYQTIYVDEMQDTTPIQAEILFYITTEEKDFNPTDWTKCKPVPGSLFLVGDPKQAIYRFAGADIAVYKLLHNMKVTVNKTLTYNFRSSEEICNYVNHRFSQLLPATANEYQAQYNPTITANGKSGKPSVIIYQEETPQEDASRIADYIEKMVDGQVLLGMEDAPHKARYGDFLILTHTRYEVEEYARMLSSKGIPYNLTGVLKLKDFEIIRKIQATINLLVDYQDETKLVLVLSQCYNLGLPLLAQYKARAGKISLFNDGNKKALEEEAANGGTGLKDYEAVLAALDELRNIYDLINQLPGIAVFEALLDKTSACWNDPQASNQSRNYALTRQLLNMVREKGYGSFLEVANNISNLVEGEVERELIIEHNLDCVRIMNVHKAKGLQAEVVFLAHATMDNHPITCYTKFDKNSWVKYLNLFEEVGKNISRRATVDGWFPDYEIEEREFQAAQTLRLLYVAATRPKTMLFICDATATASGLPCSSYWEPLIDPAFNELAKFEQWLGSSVATSNGNATSKPTGAANSLPSLDMGNLETDLKEKVDPLNKPGCFGISPSKLDHHQRATIEKDPSEASEEPEAGANQATSANGGAGEGASSDSTVTPLEEGTPIITFVPYGKDWGTIIHRIMELIVKNNALDEVLKQEAICVQAILETIDPANLTSDQKTKLLNNQDVEPLSFLKQAALNYIACLLEKGSWFREMLASADKVYAEYPFKIFEASGSSDLAGKIYAACKEAPNAPLPLEVEGIIDLLIKKDGQYYVLDYKTDKINFTAGENEAAFKVRLLQEYTNQLTCYAEILARSGRKVAGISIISFALKGERLEIK